MMSLGLNKMHSLHRQSDATVLDKVWQMHELVTSAEHMQLSSLFSSPARRMQQCYQNGHGQCHLQLAKQLYHSLQVDVASGVVPQSAGKGF